MASGWDFFRIANPDPLFWAENLGEILKEPRVQNPKNPRDRDLDLKIPMKSRKYPELISDSISLSQ